MLSRKHYRLIAQVIKDSSVKYVGLNKSMINKGNLIDNLCIVLKKDNNLFNKDKFVNACD